ncbi:MAG: DUF3604 domain-containing protein [Myxococcales bacterium]|nr:DUF3604 domain-containing protein [Myxococcales bacterium]
MKRIFVVGWVFFCGWAVCLGGCWSGCQPGETPPKRSYSEQREACQDYNPQRNAYYGDLHIHTGYSFDAWAYESQLTTVDAYRFAAGEGVLLTPLNAEGKGTRKVKLKRPLDFAGVTEHAEYLGEISLCTTPGSKSYESVPCQNYRKRNSQSTFQFGIGLIYENPSRDKEICGEDLSWCRDAVQERWRKMQEAAEIVYDRTATCKFVSFVSYEYTATPGVSNMHRNVIFRNEQVTPLPISYYEQPSPWGLWKALKSDCLDNGKGCDVISIGHNSNLSNGHYFATKYPGASTPSEQAKMAALRAQVEPLVEMFQHKGDMECRNGLFGVFGDPDPLCDFEKLRPPQTKDCKGTYTSENAGGMRLQGCVSHLDFVRNALKAGLQEDIRIGANPYVFGLIGSSDTHNGISGMVEEENFPGHVGTVDSDPVKRLGAGNITHDGIVNNPGGLAAVWAEERSRDAIFDAFRRRETFATSGPRIQVRFFGGWEFPEQMCKEEGWVKKAYATGVSMGNYLPKAPDGSKAPRFVVMAIADKGTSDAPGTPLQRVQIIKGWVGADGRPYEKVFEVAGDPNNGATVDLQTCKASGAGADTLCAVWSDPEFDPKLHAFYYARAVENPTCRWSTRECIALPAEQRPASCQASHVQKSIQERAWTSPIWFRP